ncbi:hypothetical protein [Fretibacter rubidus]|uniref:hypothetical protein n=1 Tax=Fretibacter rubidus TaxID=570162 RepID=UPI003529E461
MSQAANTPCYYASLIPKLNAQMESFTDRVLNEDLSLSKMTQIVIIICALGRLILTVHRAALKSAMLQDPIWRGRVFTDLGGIHALNRWRLRFRAATCPPIRQPKSPLITSLPPQKHQSRDGRKEVQKRFKTDRTGQFRLAAIPPQSETKPHK